MRFVQPSVRLIQSPSLDWTEIRSFLKEVEGESWADRVEGSGLSDAEALVEFAGRECYRSWEAGLNPNVIKVREDSHGYLGNILKSKHGSILEHANFTFILHNVSRVLTHELVRHRAGAAYSQESLRFVRLSDIPFWCPDWAMDDPILMEKIVQWLQNTEELQSWMADHFGLNTSGVSFHEKKHKTSFMRRCAPEGLATGIVATFNVRTIRHIVAMRTSLGAEEEIRLICDLIAHLTLEAVPGLMQDYNINKDQEWIPDFLKV